MSEPSGLIKRDGAPSGSTAYTVRALAHTDAGDLMAKTGQFRHFEVHCDEPGMGGDTAPSPMGYAALAIGF